MWTSTLTLDPSRVLMTQLLGRVWRGAYFSSFAPLQVRNLPRPALAGSNWVRVRNSLSGICGSDLHMIYLDVDPRIAPAALPEHQSSYPGHEVVGEIIEVGEDVQHLRVGDRVALQYGSNCLSMGLQPLCHACASGDYNLCERGMLARTQPIGGGWSEEMLLPEQQLFRVPSGLTDEQAVLLEPAAVALHAVLRHLPQPGDRVLIIGAGTIGLLTLKVVRALMPDVEISVQARYTYQVEQATRMGADHIIYPNHSYQDVQSATGAQMFRGLLGNQTLLGGYDVIYDTIGTKRTLHNALRWARAGATLVLVGISLHPMHIDLTPVWYQEVNLVGSRASGMEYWPLGSLTRRSTFSIVAEMVEQGQLRLDRLVTHRFALNEYRQALATATGKGQSHAIKVAFDFSRTPASTVPNVRAARRRAPGTGSGNAPMTPPFSPPVSVPPPVPPSSPVPPRPSPVTPLPEPTREQPSFPSIEDEPTRTVVVPKPRRVKLGRDTRVNIAPSSPDAFSSQQASDQTLVPPTVTNSPSSALQGVEGDGTGQQDLSVREPETGGQ